MLQAVEYWFNLPNTPNGTESHADLGLEIILVLLLLVLLVGATFAVIHFNKRKREALSNYKYETDLPELQDYGAFVRDKRVELVQTGTSQEPSHVLRYTVDFTLENGEAKSVSVPKEAFERIQKNQSGTLVLQEEQFFDFQ